MKDFRGDVKGLRGNHPVFFWGMATLVAVLLVGTVTMAVRIPQYRTQAASLDETMSEAEREARDRILNSQARRSELAIALLQREMRLAALEETSVHLAISVDDSTLALRHGPTTLRETRVAVGADTTIVAHDGRTWRLVRPLGERRVEEKQVNPRYTVPEWVYIARGEPVPEEGERTMEGALGDYVLRLNDGTEIHTRPERGPFASGSRPAAFIVEEEADMAAIFEAI
ncbi:MAG TPA: hypothetical protein VMN39_07955, partial [Longimicrobiaceae bacterium]|nr:hypothetical protein [Longimicrobiaceae bacterium]